MKPRALGPLAALLLAACGPDEPATVTGELFVVTANGDQIDLLGRRVHLIPAEAGIDSALAQVCVARNAELARLPANGAPGTDSLREAAIARAWSARGRLLSAQTRRHTRTGEGARFALDSVAPAEYLVWADARVQGERWSWTRRIRLRGGDSVHLSLSNANADEDPFRCHWQPTFRPPIS